LRYPSAIRFSSKRLSIELREKMDSREPDWSLAETRYCCAARLDSRSAHEKSRTRQIPRFPLESITKQFTAASILLLVGDGRVSVDDPIAKYYPDLPLAWRGITIAVDDP